jgi:mannose-1-phosphate guanylyltransferase
MPDRLVLLGVRPDRLEMEYGWILPGAALSSPEDAPVCEVHSFMEKPNRIQAAQAFRHGALWNTFVFAAQAELLWQVGTRCFPDVMRRFERLRSVIGQSQEAEVLDAIYKDMPAYNVSTTLLQQAAESAVVVELQDVLWSDWGQPARVAETLRRIGRHARLSDGMPRPSFFHEASDRRRPRAGRTAMRNERRDPIAQTVPSRTLRPVRAPASHRRPELWWPAI